MLLSELFRTFFSYGISGRSETFFVKVEYIDGFPDRFEKTNLGLFLLSGIGGKKFSFPAIIGG
jgi:hypothetical protein